MNTELRLESKLRCGIIELMTFPLEELQDYLPESTILLLQKQKFNALDLGCSVLQGASSADEIFSYVSSSQLLQKALNQSHLDAGKIALLKQFSELLESVINLSNLLAEDNRTNPPDLRQQSLKKLSEIVYVANGQLEAESIHLFLESFGIPSRPIQESAGVVLALTVGTLGEADVRVAPQDAADARSLLQVMKSGLLIVPDELLVDPDDEDWPDIDNF